MLHSGNFTAVLDACVLYPAQIRDYLLRLAQANLYNPKWSNEINNEWKKSLLKNRKDLKPKRLDYTIEHIRNSGLTQTADLLWQLAFSDKRII
ncbi:MAG: hypothetical protein R2730_00295 [Chitinophagales bacterium]